MCKCFGKIAVVCLPHDLIIQKLGAYGLSDSACSLVHSYLTERRQRVKIGKIHSNWLDSSRFHTWASYF